MQRFEALRKLWRFAVIYGPARTLFKAAGRLRSGVPTLTLRRTERDTAVIGCGQFAFATIAYFLQRKFGHRIAACYDVDVAARESFARAMRVPHVCGSPDEVFSHAGLRTVYVASNHASHTPYAIEAIRRGLDVYVEKPIAVTREQLAELLSALRGSASRIFSGYNRPFSRAIRELRSRVDLIPHQGITLQCFVAGHKLPPDHWYRQPAEGTRVCGNIGHWLDLMVHVLAWRGLPKQLHVALAWANDDERDDNVSITITSDRDDLFTVTLTSRCEPYEGINETIHFQHGDTICKIDDFRRMTLWQGARLSRRRYWPKDVGHELAILQPFRQDATRAWGEVVQSTLLMLHIAEMVNQKVRFSSFSFADSSAHVSSTAVIQ